jgi:hypothetical protein
MNIMKKNSVVFNVLMIILFFRFTCLYLSAGVLVQADLSTAFQMVFLTKKTIYYRIAIIIFRRYL